jgi:hypothetical protein
VEAAFEELRKDLDFKPTFCQLSDLTQVSKLSLSSEDIYALSSSDPFSKTAMRAVVARAGGAAYGIARMYQGILESDQFKVFDSILNAIAWLGLEVTDLLPASTRGALQVRTKELDSQSPVTGIPASALKSFCGPAKRKGAGE